MRTWNKPRCSFQIFGLVYENRLTPNFVICSGRAGIEISENIQISKNHVSGHKVPTLFKDLISFS